MEEAMDSSDPSVTEIHGILLAMRKNLECPICLETMKAPVSARCAHVFCRFCILKLLEQKKGVTKCPLCNGNISKITLQEDVRFELVIKGVLEAISALESDTGLRSVGDQRLHPKAVETTSTAVLQEKQIVIESQGYRGRQNGVKKVEKRNSTLQCKSSSLPLPNRTVTRCSLRKKRHSNKTDCFAIESDSSEDLFLKMGTVRRVGLRSSSRSPEGEERHAQKRSRSPCPVELQELGGEDVVLSGTPDACGLSKAGPGSTEGTGASPGSRDTAKENVAVEKRRNWSSPVPCQGRRRGHLVSSATLEGGSCSLLGMKSSRPVVEATDPAPNKQAGNKAEMVSVVQPAGTAQVYDLVCEGEQELQQPRASPESPLSPFSGKTLIQSIQKVNEWFSKSKILSPAPLQGVNAEEGDPDLNPYLSDVDSHVFQKSEPKEDQWEVAARGEVGRLLSKPVASKMVDKIFGRTYVRTRKSKRETIHIPAEETCTAVNAKSCNIPIRRIPARKKAKLELTSEDVVKQQTAVEESEGAGGHPNALLEEDGHGLAVGDGTPGAAQRPAELPAKEGVSGFELDASPLCCHSCNWQNLKKMRNPLSERRQRPGRPVCALQLAVPGSCGSADKTEAQEDGNPGSKEPREASTDQMPVRRSKRLLSWAGGEQRGSEPGKKRRKHLDEGEKKPKETQAGNVSPSVAEGGPGVLQGRQAGVAQSTSKACGAVPDGEGSLSAERPTERDRPCGLVPDAISQGSCSLLQRHLAEGEQSDPKAEEFTAAPQAEQPAVCAQAAEGESPRVGDKSIGNGEFSSETDDSELDAGFVGKIFHRCKRQSFLLDPAPSKKPAAGTHTEPSIGQGEGREAECMQKSAPGMADISEERGEAVVSRVANGTAGLSRVSHLSQSCDRGCGPEHLQALFSNSLCTPVAVKEAESGNPLQSQKPASDKRESSEMEKTSNAGDRSCGSPGLWRSGNSQGTRLHPTDETSSNTAQFLEMRPENDRNKTLACSFCSELIQPLPVARQLWPSDSRSGSVESKGGVGEQKPLKAPGEQTVQMLSTAVSEGPLGQSPGDEIPGFSLLSDTPEGLLGPATESKGCSLNPREVGRQEAVAVCAEADLEKDLECHSSSSGSGPEGLAPACRRRVPKLSSSNEDNSSEDDEVLCFQALVFGRSASTPSQPTKEKEASAEILAQRSRSQSSPKSQGEGGSPSQESEGSMNLFSSQSRASEEATGKPCDARPLTPLPTPQGKVTTPGTATGPLRGGHQACINAEPDLGEAVGDDSEVSHLGRSSSFSSQVEMLTTQQKDALQDNLKKLQQEMAVLEAALQEGGPGASAEGLSLPGEESVFAGGQTCSARGSTSKLRCGSQQSLLITSPPAGNTHRTPDDGSASSPASREGISCCLATEPEGGSSVVIQDMSSAPEHKSQGRPISPFAATTICSGRKENSRSPLLTSKRSMSLVASRLFPDELRLVQKFARETKSTWSNTFSEDTTHVIMRTDEDLVCERTLKYFLGIAAQKWVVSYQWVLQSLKEGRVLNEGDFEVRGDIDYGRNHQGPKRARESSTGKLFQGLEICCYGPFTGMQREQLERMVELCGASLVKQPHLFSCPTDSGGAVVVIQPDAWEEDSGCQGIPPPCRAAVVALDWVLDSLSCYQRLTFVEYIVQQL